MLSKQAKEKTFSNKAVACNNLNTININALS